MKISVVIPCRNEAPYIEECVHSIYACSLPENALVSVYVVDGMSDDGTRDKVKELQYKYDTLKLIDNTKQLTPYAFNLGIYAGGKVDYVQIVGARHILSKNYLQKCLEILNTVPDTWCVGGKIINEYINETGRIISEAMGTTFGMGIGNFRTLQKSGFTDTVTSPMYPYWVFEKIGFFDEQLIRNQDDDFNFRVEKAGGKIYFEHNISLKYYVRGNYKGLWRQMFQYGYWKVFVNKKHGTITTMRQLVPMFFVLYLLMLAVTSVLGLKVFVIGAMPLTLYILLNLIFSAKKAGNFFDFTALMATYCIMHVGYGLGYLNGIIHFLILRKKPSDAQKRLSR